MILTNEIFEKGKSINNGWNMEQMSLLGIKTLTKGWKKVIIGKDFPEETIKRFLELKDNHLSEKKKKSLTIYSTVIASAEERRIALHNAIKQTIDEVFNKYEFLHEVEVVCVLNTIATNISTAIVVSEMETEAHLQKQEQDDNI